MLPALAGVGYICGVKVSSYLFAGGVLGWFVIMPLMALFGGDLVLFPAEVTVNELIADGGVSNLWGNFLRYIGAGAVACGGVLSLIKSLPSSCVPLRMPWATTARAAPPAPCAPSRTSP